MSDANLPLNKKDKKRLDENRGEGTRENYSPFITINEIKSSGESIRIKGATSQRLHYLFSGIELVAFSIFDWSESVVDIRERFPLPLLETLSVCKNLGIRHPKYGSELKIITTDFLLDLAGGGKIAVSVISSEYLNKANVLRKLQIEKEFWRERNVDWLLFTEKERPDELKENLNWIRPQLAQEYDDQNKVSFEDVCVVFDRLTERSDKKVSHVCGILDDEYSLEPGYHISILKYAIAHRHINVPMNVLFHDWQCKDLIRNNQDVQDLDYVS